MRMIYSYLLVVLLAEPAYTQNDWPMISRGPQRTLWANNEWSLTPQFDNIAIFDGVDGRSLAVKGNTLYAGQSTEPNTIVAVDIETGTEFWSFEIDSSGGVSDVRPLYRIQ